MNTPAVQRTENDNAVSIPSPGSPPHKKTKYIEPVNSLSVASILNEEKSTTPTPTDIPNPGMPHPTTITVSPDDDTSSSTKTRPALQVQLLTPGAKAPTRGSAHAAGYDIYASESALIPCTGTRRGLVGTGIAIAVPEGTYGRIAPRSGLAAKHSIDVGAGVIDADYRGQVKILLFNLGDADFEVKVGDRVAQLVLERIWTPEVEVVDKLDESVRGDGGFGSTGGFDMPPLPTVT